MAIVSRDVQAGGSGRARFGGPHNAPAAPEGFRRYVTSEGKYHAIVIHPKVEDANDVRLCNEALAATGGDAIRFVDWAFATNDQRLIAFIDSRISEGLLATVAEDATIEAMRLAEDAGIEITGSIKAVRKTKKVE